MTSGHTGNEEGQPGIAAAALSGLCPRCGARTLFAGPARFAPKCRVCGLDFSRFDVGDGPAALLILIIGALVAGLAIWLQLTADPPYWLQALIWIPVTTALVIGGLRIAKAALLASEFRNKSGEARSGQ
ncbi:membrane protein [Tsuneonella deserti]|uniref:Membrane protein n=1 Tax=Tsuneonella deserti TaxID=2035528 RepID=A0ABQ1S7Z7_9SPHN|nr:DUF983 domain-containing protein [Tsuneonella deserti]GGD97402.1 membrane protein [Tsuneonella deserti]